MGTSTAILPTDYVVQLLSEIVKGIGQAEAEDYRIMWNAGMAFLWQHLLVITVILIVVWLYSFLIALMGRWGLFGSITYNYLYFGALWIIGLIFGPEIFANDYFKIVLVLLYIACFLAVGWILKKTGLRRHY